MRCAVDTPPSKSAAAIQLAAPAQTDENRPVTELAIVNTTITASTMPASARKDKPPTSAGFAETATAGGFNHKDVAGFYFRAIGS